MTKRVYKTAQGNVIDMGALILQNENVRAVGNMKINARGDKINVHGNTTVSRSEQVNKNLKKLRSNTKSEPILSSQPKPQAQPKSQESLPQKQSTSSTVSQNQTPQSGIAAAVEKAKKRK
jgi:hypothetical protein